MASSRYLITSTTLGSSAASVTFSSIPSTYTDLILKVSARSDSATAYPNDLLLKINSITTGYSVTEVEGYGSTAGSQRLSQNRMYYGVNSASQTANTFATAEIYIPNYNSSAYKQIGYALASAQNSTSNVADSAGAFLLSNTAAVTSLNISTDSNFVSNSTFTLYGLKNS